MPRRCRFALPLVLLGLHVTVACAGHPMMSEDTGTQGTGNAELEQGYAWSNLDGSGSLLFQPQLSYGLTPALDLIVQPSWQVADAGVAGRVRAFGDTNVDAKWRFQGASPWSLGVRGGLQLPTSQEGLGIPHDRVAVHAILVATADFTPFVLDVNVGMGRAPADAGGRSDLYHVSVAALYSVNDSLFVLADAAADTNPVATGPGWQGTLLTGVIYTLRPGLDLDVGYLTRLDAVGPAQQWLLGITVRGAFPALL